MAMHLKSEIKQQILANIDTLNIDQIAWQYAQQGRWGLAIYCYEIYTTSKALSADAQFNYSFYLAQAGEPEKAIEGYYKAIELGLRGEEEALLNIAKLYSENLRDEAKSESILTNLLAKYITYAPAMFNLAGLYEEQGKKQQASQLYHQIIQRDPHSVHAYIRLVYLDGVDSENDYKVEKLKLLLARLPDESPEKMQVLYALGKAHESLHDYINAFTYYKRANIANERFNVNYVQENYRIFVENCISAFSKEWQSTLEGNNNHSPIFICGMYRSGSTLLEQILSSHSSLKGAGERNFFKAQANKLERFVHDVSSFTIQQRMDIAQEYVEQSKQLFGQIDNLIDKKPDNIEYIPLIKSIFPHAKIIITDRDAYSNTMAIYFQCLGEDQGYATDLGNIEHYLEQNKKLAEHFYKLFPQSVYRINYSELVTNPEKELSKLLTFLGLPWEDNVLNFYKQENHVKTASIWQVRQPLYSSSLQKYEKYREFLD